MVCLGKGDVGADEEPKVKQKRKAGCCISWREEKHCCGVTVVV
jgi:hypothetical protein